MRARNSRKVLSSLIFTVLLCSAIGSLIQPVAATDPDAEDWPTNGDYVPPYGGYLKTRDGVDLATLIYSNDFFWDSTPGPIIMMRSPYDISGDSSDLTAWNYVNTYPGSYVVTQDMRGRYHSDGVDRLFGDDWQDGYDTYLYLKNDPTFNWMWDGKLASWGASALCINQYCYAGEDIPELRAQYLSVGSPEQYDHIFYQGGQFRYNMIKQWSQSQGSSSWAYARDTLSQHPKKDSWWAKRSLEMGNRFANVHASAVHYGGWDDPFSQGTIRGFMGYNYEGASDARGHQILILGGIGHGFIVGDINWPDAMSIPSAGSDAESFLFNTELMEFNGARGSGTYEAAWDARTKVFYYMYSDPAYHGVDSRACAWHTANDWPVSNTPQKWYFHKGNTQHTGELELFAPSGTESQSYIYDPNNPCPTNGGNNLFDTHVDSSAKIGQGSTDQRGDGFYYNNGLPNIVTRNDVITFTSDTLDSAYEFTGNVQAKLYVQSDQPDTDFVAKLIDVFPDGREMLITDGLTRSCRRNGFDQTDWMSSGNTYEVDVDLWSKAWRFQPGHKIKLLITSSNYPRFLRNPNKQQEIIPTSLPGDYNVAVNTIMLSQSYPSYIELPITDGWIDCDEPNIWITSDTPEPSQSTSYNVKWDSEYVDSVDIKLNGATVATGQPASNTGTGYQVTGLTPNIDNTIQVVGNQAGDTPDTDSISVHPYCDPPDITMSNPDDEETFFSSSVNVQWSIDSTNSAGLSNLWIETDSMAKKTISKTTTEYLLEYLADGDHWVEITAEGVNGLKISVNHSFSVDTDAPEIWITSGQPEIGATEYTITWDSLNVEAVNITVNGVLNATNLPASNPTTGYTITGLTNDIDYDIQIIGNKTGFSSATDTIIVHPFADPPEITIIGPTTGEMLWGGEVMVNFSIRGYVQDYWIKTTNKPMTQIETMTSNYTIEYEELAHGANVVNITALGYDGNNVSAEVSFTFDKAHIAIQNGAWGFADDKKINLAWNKQYCNEYRIKLNGKYYGGVYDNNSIPVEITGLKGNQDNIIQLIGSSTDYAHNVTDTYIAHPYTDDPHCIIWAPNNHSTIRQTYYNVKWYENHTAVENAGGIQSITITSSGGTEKELDANIRFHEIDDWKHGSQWVKLTVVGNNGHIYETTLFVDVDDPAYHRLVVWITIGSVAAATAAVAFGIFIYKRREMNRIVDKWTQLGEQSIEDSQVFEDDDDLDESGPDFGEGDEIFGDDDLDEDDEFFKKESPDTEEKDLSMEQDADQEDVHDREEL